MRKNMKRSRKSNRVSWAPGVDLCQVKLFSSEDCPAKVGLNFPDHFQAKTSWTGSNDLPPGFERSFAVSKSGLEPSYKSQIQWNCPPKFALSPTWQVASGEETEEAKHQRLREMRVLEAVYPRFSAIPPSPSVSLEIKNEYYDDSQTPLVPVTPIEEEEFADTPNDIAAPVNTTISSQSSALSQVPSPSEPRTSKLDSPPRPQPLLGKLPDLGGADVLAAASTTLAAIITSNEKGSLIDPDLLIKLLSDPNMIQKLMKNGSPANTGSAPISESNTVRPADGNSFQIPNGVRNNLSTVSQPQDTSPVSRFQQVVTPPCPVSAPDPFSLPRLSDGNPFSIPNQARSAVNAVSVQPNTVTSSPFAVKEPVRPMKDLNYYKNLIRQHGAEKEENKDSIHAQNGKNYYHFQEPKLVHNFKQAETKMKNSKSCIYFKSSKGCRNGANCPYQHDVPVQWRAGNVMGTNSAKRMRLNGEINGGMLV